MDKSSTYMYEVKQKDEEGTITLFRWELSLRKNDMGIYEGMTNLVTHHLDRQDVSWVNTGCLSYFSALLFLKNACQQKIQP
ncbi:hypothetical protein P9222_20520 [Paenibacillus amylolyticus]|nr:hypothetical protein [Paenibacillus amylolyticus]WFR60914.1 hypothetical protein P9222_20520 [Paenibacillus amylolyticus]